jgi:uncharacterized membrane protein
MEPQRLQAGRGWEWIKQGYALFMKAPLLWVVVLLICLAAVLGISAIPMIGEPLVSLMMPALVVGLMAGCRALQNGEELELAHLFIGFRQHTSPLVTLGGITLVCQYLILGAMMLVGGSTLVGILMSSSDISDPEMIAKAVAGAGLAVLLGLALFSVLLMATQFSPMLVYFNNAPPLPAMRLSIRAFAHNIMPMLVYCLTFIPLALLASLPMMLGWLVLLPVIFTSLYAAYSDIFPPIKEPSSAHQGEFISRDDAAHF